MLLACGDRLDVKKFNRHNDLSSYFAAEMKYNFVTIEGNIGAGKTTLSHLLSKHYNARLILEEFADNPFCLNSMKTPASTLSRWNYFFMAERYKQLKELLQTKDIFPTNHHFRLPLYQMPAICQGEPAG